MARISTNLVAAEALTPGSLVRVNAGATGIELADDGTISILGVVDRSHAIGDYVEYIVNEVAEVNTAASLAQGVYVTGGTDGAAASAEALTGAAKRYIAGRVVRNVTAAIAMVDVSPFVSFADAT
jgi:hypothetical protein